MTTELLPQPLAHASLPRLPQPTLGNLVLLQEGPAVHCLAFDSVLTHLPSDGLQPRAVRSTFSVTPPVGTDASGSGVELKPCYKSVCETDYIDWPLMQLQIKLLGVEWMTPFKEISYILQATSYSTSFMFYIKLHLH